MNVTGGTEPVVNTVSGWRQFVSGFNEALTMAWRALAANKMRTLLTMLGIIIGIASVVSIVVVGDAAKQMVLADIRSIGTNTIDVYPGKILAMTIRNYQQALKYDDLIAIQNNRGSPQPHLPSRKTCACVITMLMLLPVPMA